MSSIDRELSIQLDDCWNRIGVWSKEQASCPELDRYVHCRNCNRYSAAGRQILERPVPEQFRREHTTYFSQSEKPAETGSNSVLVFRLGDEWLALNSGCINEVTAIRYVHGLPHRSDSLVKGFVNIRGELKICVSLGSLLQLDKASASYAVDHEILERMIFAEKDGQDFVFPVSEVHGIHRYPDSALQAAPQTVAKSKNSFTTGILDWNSRHVGILDDDLLFYALVRHL
jgi:chemotaxis-related protein WspD